MELAFSFIHLISKMYLKFFFPILQCAYNSAKSKIKFDFWGSHWRHGDSLLFALACSQVRPIYQLISVISNAEYYQPYSCFRLCMHL